MIKGGLKMPDRQAFLTMFLESMYTEKTTPQIREFILNKMSATPNHVGDSAMNDLFNLDKWRDLPVLDVPLLAIYVKSLPIWTTMRLKTTATFSCWKPRTISM
jgi:hypothetical protein